MKFFSHLSLGLFFSALPGSIFSFFARKKSDIDGSFRRKIFNFAEKLGIVK